jgi:aromatic ring-opening dioxygenase LigB subunit
MFVGISFFPHGAMILDMKLEDLPPSARILHDACINSSLILDQSNADTIILITPHGLSLDRSLGIYMNEKHQGSAAWNGDWTTYCLDCNNDNEFTNQIRMTLAANDIAIQGITTFSIGCNSALAWGEVVPLWFHQKTINERNIKVVIISVSQERLNPRTYSFQALENNYKVLFNNQRRKYIY